MTTLSPPPFLGKSSSDHDRHQSRSGNGRTRAVSALSNVSGSSRRSKESKQKMDLTETSKDKKRLNTKADPSKALAEATPAEIAQTESTLDNLRRISVTDAQGNRITEPDRSNPTRYRFERPLDTIRSFNAAAEGTSHRRSSLNAHQRSVSQYSEMNTNNRQSGYHSNLPSPRNRPAPPGGYYRNSYGMGAAGSYEDAQEPHYYNGNSQQQRLRYPGTQYGNAGLPQESPISGSPRSNQPSYETMTSGSDAENGKSTNPSSLNSSYDQLYQLRKPDAYGQQRQQDQNYPYSDDTQRGGRPGPYANPQSTSSYGGGAYGGPVQPGPAPPAKENGASSSYVPNNPRKPIKLDGSGPTTSTGPDSFDGADGARRGSWLKRTFSRKPN